MFNLFKKKVNDCPIDNDMRLWMENSFLWLVGQFGEDSIYNKEVLIPSKELFPFRFNGSLDCLNNTATIIAEQMEINIQEIKLHVFKENIREIQAGDMGYRVFTESDESSKMAAGLFFDNNEEGKYDIYIEEQQLVNPEGLVATLAHEFSHIKLLGEKRLEFNDEMLTDLTTVIFGLGIFNSNAYFNFSQGYDGWKFSTTGYLHQQQWGYALALYAYYRQEKEPAWIKHLVANLKSDFKKSSEFIYNNQNKIFMEEYSVGQETTENNSTE